MPRWIHPFRAPQIESSIPHSIDVKVAMDQTVSAICASDLDTERTLILSVLLVILVVFAFLRNSRAT